MSDQPAYQPPPQPSFHPNPYAQPSPPSPPQAYEQPKIQSQTTEYRYEQPEQAPAAPEPEPEPAPAADEPSTLAPVPPDVPQDENAAAPEETGVITASGTHPRVLVALRDVLAHVENFFARNPHLRGQHEADLKSALNTLERRNS
jgi:hypothetical protein